MLLSFNKDTCNLLYKFAFILENNHVHIMFSFVEMNLILLSKERRHARNMTGYRDTATVPGQRVAKITVCYHLIHGALYHIPTIGPHNSECLISFIDILSEGS